MKPFDVLARRASELTGVVADPASLAELQRRVGRPLPDWLVHAMSELPLAGTSFGLPNAEPDTIGFGEAMRWLTPAQIAEEIFDVLEECSPMRDDYIPIALAWHRVGDTRIQIADPLCVPRSVETDPPLISISHECGPDAVGNLLVVPRLAELLQTARIIA